MHTLFEEVHTLFDDESEDVIWNTTVAEIATFRKYGKLPTFGLTAGRYPRFTPVKKKNKRNAAIQMQLLCLLYLTSVCFT